MRATPFKIFVSFPNGRGFVDGYQRAATARAEVGRINAASAKTGVEAYYLGDERNKRTFVDRIAA